MENPILGGSLIATPLFQDDPGLKKGVIWRIEPPLNVGKFRG